MSSEARAEAARELARLLVRRLRDRGEPADAPMTVAELRRELLPYPRCREEAGLASKAEYDLALLDLLASPRALRAEDPELAEAVEEERGAAEPGLGFLERFAATTLRPGPALAGGTEAPSEPASSAEQELRREPEPASPTDPAAGSDPPAASEPSATPESPVESRGCPSCGGDLPDRDGLRFCPWCGADLTTPRCADCGEEMEPDWRYCPGCGAPAPSDG